MLKIENISKRFGGVQALRNCTFTVPPHKITALIGPNGAGKTTLFDVISGLVNPDTGSITLSNSTPGVELVGLAAHAVASMGVSRTWQQVRLFRHLTILDHFLLVESNENTKLFKSFVRQPAVENAPYLARLEAFGIRRPLETVVTDLSYGQRKLLQLALALHRPHTLLLLDEPVAGVNPLIQEQIERALLDLKEQQFGPRETIVIIEHDIEFVKRLADYVVVLDQGRVLVEGPPEVALQDERVVEAYLGV